MFSSARSTAAVLAVALLSACSSAIDEPEAARPAGEDGRYGLLVMTHDFGDPGVAVSGQLAAWSGQPRAAVLHALALPDMAWLVAGVPAVGHCRAVSAPRTSIADGSAGQVTLLGAGELTVTPPGPLSPDDALHLQPREFPRLFFSVGGVVYDADAPQALPFLAHGTYHVRAPGDEVGPIVGDVQAPGPVHLLDETVGAEGLHVRWSGRGAAMLTLSRESGGAVRGVQCRAPAGGSFLVPAAALVPFGPGEAQLSVGEVSRRRVTVAGLSALDLFFVSRDQAVVRLPSDPVNE